MKLKTLKDLEEIYCKKPAGWVKIRKLKAEAIKHLKEIYPKKFTYKQLLDFPRSSWIIDFFSITEDSLSDIKQLNEKERAK